ncbi:hypothetical protein [Methanobacterium sp.]|uniref:hypothetical protein n=1 Tax=Methanobacterium sp. TaxID=2164 RepID=UPI003C784738
MGWTSLQHQPLKNSLNFWRPENRRFSRAFFREKRLDQKTPEKSLIFQVRKSITFDNINLLGKRLSQLNFNYESEI